MASVNGIFLRLIFWSISILKGKGYKKDATKVKGCPTDKALIEFLTGKMRGINKENLSNHIVNCKNCQANLKELKTINDLGQTS